MLSVDKDAFSSGQMGSKLWLCEQLEELFEKIDSIWIYGGWYAVTALLLRSRNRIEIKEIRSIDIDPYCESVADMLNENWVIKEWQFKAVTEDCNKLLPTGVDLIINTSTEHFTSKEWFDNIPQGTVVALQGNNMPHDDHYFCSDSLDDFCANYSLTDTMYRGSLDFNYPDWKFTRYMVIGVK
jgi:hypothetical protein